MKIQTGIPTTKQIIHEACERIRCEDPTMLKPAFIRDNFSPIVERVFQYSYDIYLEYEDRVIERLTNGTLARIDNDTLTKAEIRPIIEGIAREAISVEKSLKQSRYARAGHSLEAIVQMLLKEIGIKSERITREDKKSGLRPIDLVVPDRKTAIESPDGAHFLSLKTSLKDRWKLVVEDQRQGQRTHLITLLQREKLTDQVAKKILDRGIFLYIPDSIKDDCFPDNPRVRRISALPSQIE